MEALEIALSRSTHWMFPSRTLKRSVWPLALGGGYVAAIASLGGLRIDHVVIGSLALLDLYNEGTRKFIRAFFPIVLTGVIYDVMRYFYWPAIEGRVHVAGPYFRDLSWFGISATENGVRKFMTPNEYWAAHPNIVLDLLCGFAYLTFVAEYLVTAFFLFFRGRIEALRRFAICFLTVNVLGFATYFVYPAAPPWYVSQYGLGPARMSIAPHAAAAQRFDLLLGTHFFDEIYGRGIDVYGAYPSLHVTYPLLVLLTCLSVPELRLARVPALVFYLLICLSAVYLQHHYVCDVLLGTLYVAVLWTISGALRPRAVES